MRHLTLLLLSVFTVYQAKADILIPLDKYPTGEKTFQLTDQRKSRYQYPLALHHVIWRG